jgi:hypothetical protein
MDLKGDFLNSSGRSWLFLGLFLSLYLLKHEDYCTISNEKESMTLGHGIKKKHW